MAATITSSGILGLASDFSTDFFGWYNGQFSVRLFTNNFTPDVGSTDPTLFTEATFGGYAGIAFNQASNGMPTYASGVGSCLLNNGAFAWVCTSAPQTVYGYYIVETDVNLVWAAERFPTPQNVVIGGTLSLMLTSQITQG